MSIFNTKEVITMYKTLIISLIVASSAWGQDTPTADSPTKKRQENWVTCYLATTVQGKVTCTEMNLKYISKIVYEHNVAGFFNSDESLYILCPEKELVKGRQCVEAYNQ